MIARHVSTCNTTAFALHILLHNSSDILYIKGFLIFSFFLNQRKLIVLILCLIITLSTPLQLIPLFYSLHIQPLL